MSTRKEQTRQDEEEKQLASQELLHQREQQQSINKALDETKNNIRRTADEARKDKEPVGQTIQSVHTKA